MRRDRPSLSERAVLGSLIALSLGTILSLPRYAPRLVILNESPSLPRGLYVRDWTGRPGPGAVVAVRQPKAAGPYLRTLGMPAQVLLIKRVGAIAGEHVCERSGVLAVRGRRLAVARRDRLGALLPRWDECRRLDPGELFLLGDTPTSFDSRYFGPVRTEQVEGVFKEMLTW